MTPAAAVLFVFVIHGAARGPADVVVAACLRALPAGTRAVTQTATEAPADAALLASAMAAGAAAAVVVTSPAADLSRSDIRAAIGLPEHARWVSRTVSFGPADQVPERERALALVIASIVQEGYASSSERPPRQGRQPPLAASTGPEPPRVSVSNPTPAPVAPPSDDWDRPARWAVEAGVTTSYESGTDADDSIGGTLAVRRFLLPYLAARVGAAFRLSQRDTPDLTVTGLALIGTAGVGWTSGHFGPGRRFAAGARVDLLVQHQTVRVSGSEVAGGDQGYWSLGTDAVGELGLALARSTTLLVAGGLEEMFSEADVVAHGRDAATLHHARVVLQVGVLSRF